MNDSRGLDRKIKLNTTLLFAFRVFSIGIGFLLVPLLIDYLDVQLYGVWLTILSVTMWINYFDIGIGNGLRNKLTESLVEGNIERAKSLVSTAYVMLTFISISAFVIFLLISGLGSWSRIFNVDGIYNAELRLVMLAVMGSVLINFILSLNNHVAYANQEASFSGLWGIISQSFLLMGVLALLTTSKHGGLFSLAVIYALSTVGSNVMLTFYLFRKHRNLIPSPKYFSLNHIKPLMALGTQFFVIQIAALTIFATDNMIIIHVLGPSEVTTYNVIYRLFTPILFVHTILITPLWSAFTESYANNNLKWIKSIFKKLKTYTLLLALAIVAIALSAKPIIFLWLKDLSFYSVPLVAVMAIYTFIMIWNNNYAYFLNGVSKLRVQLYTAVIGGAINIPISIFLAQNVGLGSAGVAVGSIISLSLFAIAGPLQSANILKNRIEVIKHDQAVG
jgi:O-antigen/teichoic acid export membrane protein